MEKEYEVSIVFYADEWSAEEIDGLLVHCEVRSHHAQNAAVHRCFSAEDVQEELIENLEWDDATATIDKIGDDGSPTLTVVARVPESEWERVKAALELAASPQVMTLNYDLVGEVPPAEAAEVPVYSAVEALAAGAEALRLFALIDKGTLTVVEAIGSLDLNNDALEALSAELWKLHQAQAPKEEPA